MIHFGKLPESTFLVSGIWQSLAVSANELDPGGLARWTPLCLKIAAGFAEHQRYLSGVLTVIALTNANPYDYLAQAIDQIDPKNDPQAVTNLLIAFTTLAEANYGFGGKDAPVPDETRGTTFDAIGSWLARQRPGE